MARGTTALSLDCLASWVLLVSGLQAHDLWVGEKQCPTVRPQAPEPHGSMASCPGLLSGADTLSSRRDGAPYCEKDYQGLFGVKCEACHQFITGKVLEVSGGQAARKAAFPSEALGPAEESGFPFFLTGIVEEIVEDQPPREGTCWLSSQVDSAKCACGPGSDGECDGKERMIKGLCGMTRMWKGGLYQTIFRNQRT